MTWIKVIIEFVAVQADGKSVDIEQAQRVVDQVRRDALFGTFNELNENFWKNRMERPPSELSAARYLEGKEQDGRRVYSFELSLSAALFSPSYGGMQHLFSILSGDLLQFTLPPVDIKSISVKSIDWPQDWEQSHIATFRAGNAYNIPDLRQALALDEGMPLLAFSFKPRVGFRLDALEEVAVDVLGQGFNLVELDTRFLPQSDQQMDDLIDLAVKISQKTKKKGRLSLNLSLPTDQALRCLTRLGEKMEPPVVVKVDGGLDGFSCIQAMRRAASTMKKPPIITCYPLIRSALAPFVPRDRFLDGLALSGADILYPGGRPDLGFSARTLGNDVARSRSDAAARYKSIVQRGWPMPSIAGGIYAGQLQAYYEVLGPDVAWFLGGGVALHKDGPKAGASLCVRTAQEAKRLRTSAKMRGQTWADNLPDDLAIECQAAYAGRSSLEDAELKYLAPSQLGEPPGLLPYEKTAW